MSLVAAYDDSSDEGSDGSEDIPQVAPVAVKKGLSLPAPKKASNSANDDAVKEPQVAKKPEPKGMFSALPAPKRDFMAELVVEETDEPIPGSKNGTTVKQKVKISVPSLSQFNNEEEDAPKPKKQKLTPKGSGLLALLPEPVNTLTSKAAFLPYVLTKKPTPKPTPVTKKPTPAKPVQKAALLLNYSDSEDESGDEGGSTPAKSSGIDFFSLTNQVQPAPIEVNLDDYLPQAGPSKPAVIPETTYAIVDEVEEASEEQEEQSQETELSDEAIRKLCGRRQEDLGNMIDIQGETVFADAKEWMLKNMTEEPERDYSHRDNTPNSTMKRKHHITHLAFQAKENETELKNQWAANRQSKKQTQAKYGF